MSFVFISAMGLLSPTCKKTLWVFNSKQARSEKALCSAVAGLEVLEEREEKSDKNTDSVVYISGCKATGACRELASSSKLQWMFRFVDMEVKL